jgi:DNA-binding NarL/FixJ family response regulator
MKRITVFIAEDHQMVREGIRMMLKLEPDMVVAGEATNGREAVKSAIELKPDVILMDVAMPGLNGLEATRQLIKALPSIRIIILTAHNDDAYVKSAVDSGASGYLLKQDSGHNVCLAIREVYRGGIYYSSSIAKRFIRINPQSVDRSGKKHRKANQLTSREMEVLQLIAEGKANKETAVELGISIKTVEKHRGHLMDKLDIHDTAGLTRYAVTTGIIESSVQITIIGEEDDKKTKADQQ